MPFEHVVILLPGISGSVLSRGGKDIWGTGAGALARMIGTLGTSLQQLKLSDEAQTNVDFDDDIVASGLVQDLHTLPGLWKIDGYTKAADYIVTRLGLRRGENFYEFPYDWRLDNRRAASRLATFGPDVLKKWRTSSNNDKAKLVLVGHSMGGLVSRYYLECLEGWRDTHALVTFGTPYRGSLNALGFLANGYSKGIGPLKIDLSGVLQSMDSVYQLLPIFDCLDTGTGSLQKLTEVTGIPGLDEQRVNNAAEFHGEIKRAQVQNRTLDGYTDSYKTYPVAGTFQPTWQSAKVTDGSVALLRTWGDLDNGGDGTVPRWSAFPPEQEDTSHGMFTENLHGSLQNVEAVLQQLHGVLTASKIGYRAPPIDLERTLASISRPGVMLADVYGANIYNEISVEPATIQAERRVLGDLTNVTATITDVETRRKVDDLTFRRDVKGLHHGKFKLPAGAYRIEIRAEEAPQSVTDTFLVVDGGQ